MNVQNELVVATEHHQPSLLDMAPTEMVEFATAMANVLAKVIDDQKLYTMIQGKKHVRVEGWATMGSMLGVLPREVEVKEKENGDYEATVELYSIRTNQVVGRGSALCGADEKRWGSADRFARRSMAITRATGKAYRLGFAWVISLAGFEPCPAEEMPHDKPVQKAKKAASVYNHEDDAMQKKLASALSDRKVPEEFWEEIGRRLHGKSTVEINSIVAAVASEQAQ